MHLIKRLRYEYWPWYLFFIPALPVCLYWMIRTRKILYFTAANPSIELGGFFGEKKNNIIQHISDEFKPRTKFIAKEIKFQGADFESFNFPVILKPNVGERGDGVEKIDSMEVLLSRIDTIFEDHVLQEFIDYPIELGLFYFRYPDGSKSGITSLTLKGFMQVVGDGVSNIRKLMNQNTRSRLQIKRLEKEKQIDLNEVLQKNEVKILEVRGNHCLGTEFIDANDRITPELTSIFDSITSNYEGFHYGRFDLKTDSWENLYAGKNIRIFELNGVSSEPGHIYDVRNNLLNAYISIAKHWMIMGEISSMQIKRGVKTTPLKEFISTVKKHFIQ